MTLSVMLSWLGPALTALFMGLVTLLLAKINKSSGEIHEMVNSNLTAYKNLVIALMIADTDLRTQLKKAGIEPTVPRVTDTRQTEATPPVAADPGK